MYSVLHVRTASRPTSDLTARARIIDAAVAVFAEQGASASMRAIAAAAGVSPGLITHHFGTKEALKAECDERVLDTYTDMNMAGIADPIGSMDVLEETDPEQVRHMETLTQYVMRAFLDGGPTAQQFYGRFLSRIRDIMTAAAASGMVRQICADETYVRYLAASNLGFMLVQFVTDPPETSGGFYRHLMTHPALMEAMIDVLTSGVFTDDQVLAGFRTAINKKEKIEQNV